MNQNSSHFKLLVSLPLVLSITMYLGSLILIGTTTATHLKAAAFISLGISIFAFMATTWLNRAPFNWYGGLDPKSRPVWYHVGMFLLTAAALTPLATGVLMLREAVLEAR